MLGGWSHHLIATAKTIARQPISCVFFRLIVFALIPPQLADINLVICNPITMLCKLAPILPYLLNICCIENLSMRKPLLGRWSEHLIAMYY